MSIIIGRANSLKSHYIGRGSPLGNPFPMNNQSNAERNRVCDAYEQWFQAQIKAETPAVMRELRKIYALSRKQNVILGCFCSPKRCHGDTIKSFIENFQ